MSDLTPEFLAPSPGEHMHTSQQCPSELSVFARATNPAAGS